MEIINSLQNEKYKDMLRLLQKKQRETSGLFLVEGKKEIDFGTNSLYECLSIWATAEDRAEAEAMAERQQNVRIYIITSEMMGKLVYRDKTENMIAVFKKKTCLLKELVLESENEAIIIASNIEKPGNIGSLFRVADASGVSAIVFTNQSADVYNPNVIRNSVGTFLNSSFFIEDQAFLSKWLKLNNFKIISADPEIGKDYWDIDLKGRVALVFGSEHEGIGQYWKDEATELAKIPMLGRNDSLNVSVSAGVLCYERIRQLRNV